MSEVSHGAAAGPLAAGWGELREARWDAARVQFERALAGGETPEALEGLSWAAWWLDDAAAVFAAREGAYRLYRGGGDHAGAARMAIWLAVDQLDFHGAWAPASGWLRRAHRLLDPLEPGPEHGWLAFHEGYLAHAEGETEVAGELGAQAARLGRRFGVADLEMLGLALEGATHVGCARVPEGMRCLDEATAAALEGEATIPISSAWTFCILVSACTAALDFGRASEWCDRIAAFAERYGSRYMLAYCRAEYGAVHMWTGRWADAEAMLEAAVEDFSSSRPAWVGGPLVTLAELRRRQGRTADALELLERAGPSAGAQLLEARLAWDAARAPEAVNRLDRLLRRLPAERALDRAPAVELLVHVLAAAGDLDRAAGCLEVLRGTAAHVGTPALRACVDSAAAALAAAEGEHDRARALLEDAVDGFEAVGAPFEAARARLELATCLYALGRPEEGGREASSARDRLHALGAGVELERARRLATAGAPDASALTPREREVLVLLAEGLRNRQIAERLVVSEHTVHRHVTNLLRKLGLPSRAAAAAHAVRSGLAGGTRE